MALCLTSALASVRSHQFVLTVTRTALDGLAVQEAFAADAPDLADLPAMDPILATVVDPRLTVESSSESNVRESAIQPFLYEPRAGETLLDIAARFGVSLASLLWNNGLASPDEVPAGLKLTVLPVAGVVHRVQAGETLAQIAERYSVRVDDLMAANALPGPDVLWPGQALVVRGGVVPLPQLPPMSDPTPDRRGPSLLVNPVDAALADSSDGAPAASSLGRVAPAEDLPPPPGATRFQRSFILEIAPGARESQRITGVPASVTLAQAILESDWGQSRLAREAKNLFGIKAHTRPGTAGVYTINAWEVINGMDVISPETFRAYTSWADSIVDHGKWFHQQPRYRGALAVRDDPRAFARAINAAGYATDPAYSDKLIALMDRYNLYQYDVD